VVKHLITETERPLVFTDRAMTETSVQHAAGMAAEAEAEAEAEARAEAHAAAQVALAKQLADDAVA
jgi:hypothetical protein